jgi:hypothetical protein
VTDPADVVRRGYDAVSHLYRRDGDQPADYLDWLAALRIRTAAGSPRPV